MHTDPFADPRPLIRSVYAFVAYRIGDGPDAEDVTGETFARALRYRDSYDADKGPPIGWLIGIARRCIADRALTRPVAELDESLDGAADGDLAGDVVRRLALRAAVAQLDEAGRELIALRFGADLTARQIAELTGKKTHAVEVALQRTLERLRLALTEQDGPETPAARAAPSPVRFWAARRYSN
jgi:RNA polymerase sigma-70 factor, ECF subfamily